MVVIRAFFSSVSIIGKLNSRVLNLFRMSEVERLDLVPSMMEEGELNLDARDLLCGNISNLFPLETNPS